MPSNMQPMSPMSPRYNFYTITHVRALNLEEGNSKPEVLNEILAKLDTILSLKPDSNRSDANALLLDISKKKLALKLAIKTIQENMNHGGENYFHDKHYYGKFEPGRNIKKGESAVELFNSIINDSLLCDDGQSLKSKIEYLCCHSNSPIKDRKISLYKTNYTNHAKLLRNHIVKFTPSSFNVSFDQSGKTISDFTSSDIQNLRAENNHGSHIITISTVNSINPTPAFAGKWCVKIAPDKVNKLTDIMKNSWTRVLSKFFLKIEIFLMDDEARNLDQATEETNEPEMFDIDFYVADYTNKECVKKAYAALVKIGIIQKNQEINFKKEQGIMEDNSQEILFTSMQIDAYYQFT